MKNTIISFSPFMAICLSFIAIISCTKEDVLKQDTPEPHITPRTEFEPSVSVYFNDDYLQFESFADLDVFLLEANLADPEAVNDWEDNLDFTSQRKIFHDAMIAEDALEDYHTSLSPTQQATILAQGEYHSSELNSAISSGKLKTILAMTSLHSGITL